MRTRNPKRTCRYIFYSSPSGRKYCLRNIPTSPFSRRTTWKTCKTVGSKTTGTTSIASAKIARSWHNIRFWTRGAEALLHSLAVLAAEWLWTGIECPFRFVNGFFFLQQIVQRTRHGAAGSAPSWVALSAGTSSSESRISSPGGFSSGSSAGSISSMAAAAPHLGAHRFNLEWPKCGACLHEHTTAKLQAFIGTKGQKNCRDSRHHTKSKGLVNLRFPWFVLTSQTFSNHAVLTSGTRSLTSDGASIRARYLKQVLWRALRKRFLNKTCSKSRPIGGPKLNVVLGRLDEICSRFFEEVFEETPEMPAQKLQKKRTRLGIWSLFEKSHVKSILKCYGQEHWNRSYEKTPCKDLLEPVAKPISKEPAQDPSAKVRRKTFTCLAKGGRKEFLYLHNIPYERIKKQITNKRNGRKLYLAPPAGCTNAKHASAKARAIRHSQSAQGAVQMRS